MFFLFCFAVDVTPPYLVTCPADIMINLPGGDAPVRVDFDVPTAQDNSGTATLVSNNFSPNDLFPLGRTVVMYRFADAAGNSVTCSFAVEVNEGTCISFFSQIKAVAEMATMRS